MNAGRKRPVAARGYSYRAGDEQAGMSGSPSPCEERGLKGEVRGIYSSSGVTLRLWWKKLVGSYCRLTARSRSSVAGG